MEKEIFTFSTICWLVSHGLIKILTKLGADQGIVQKYQLYSANDYYYINQGQSPRVDGIDDADDYRAVRVGLFRRRF
jgi:hypothetical protein